MSMPCSSAIISDAGSYTDRALRLSEEWAEGADETDPVLQLLCSGSIRDLRSRGGVFRYRREIVVYIGTEGGGITCAAGEYVD